MDPEQLSLSPIVIVGAAVALGAVALLVVAAASAGRARREHEKVRAREEELERLLLERSASLHDAVERAEEANRRLQGVERHDRLTGLASRDAFLEAVEMEWKRGRREKTPLAVLFLGIDGFSDIDRRLGSGAGDDCLRHVAAVLGTGLRRAGDLVGRWGEERFAVVLPATGMEGAGAVAKRLLADLDALAAPGAVAGATVSMSAGIAAVVPGRGHSGELVAAAEAALGEARRRGPRQVAAAAGQAASVLA